MDKTERARYLKELHDGWAPHPGQVPPIVALFRLGMLLLFLECGRKFGKTELLLYFLIRSARMNPNSANYYFAPYQKQARELIWANQRIQNFVPRSWLAKKPNDTEMRITLDNGAFIKLDGSDNYDSYRGVGKGMAIVVYEEYKDFRPEFHMAFGPNIADNVCPLVVAGSPPEMDCDYTVMADQVKTDPTGVHFCLPSWLNPHIDKKWLKSERQRLYARGEGVVWEREYGARRVRGGPNAIFPMFSRDRHVRPHENVMNELLHDKPKLQWLAIADPGTITVFAVLYMAVNPYKKTVYMLDEIYAQSTAETSTSQIIPEHRDKKRDLYRDCEQWWQPCDEAAAWFINEAAASYEEYFFATKKSLHKKTEGLSLIKDQMINNRVVISDRCQKLIWEIENYVKDKHGKIPKENDHLIDNWRYGNATAGLSLLEEAEPVQDTFNEDPRERAANERRQMEQEDDLFNHYGDMH